VLAPHAGLALAFDWSGNAADGIAYQTVVAIWDPVSHVVTQLMHVNPKAAIKEAHEPVHVVEGEVVGELAALPISGEGGERLRHTHVDFIDGEHHKILNPGKLFRDYRDRYAPLLKNFYVADAQAQVTTTLVSGNIDIVAEVFDRDDDSQRNFEPSAIAYEIQDQAGHVVLKLERCNLDELYESVEAPSSFRAKQLLDFGSAESQRSGAWPNSDIDNANRTFRYALTQLRLQGGRCTVMDDASAFLVASNDMTALRIALTLWDLRDNRSDHVRWINR
jgi:hypothetical protein